MKLLQGFAGLLLVAGVDYGSRTSGEVSLAGFLFSFRLITAILNFLEGRLLGIVVRELFNSGVRHFELGGGYWWLAMIFYLMRGIRFKKQQKKLKSRRQNCLYWLMECDSNWPRTDVISPDYLVLDCVRRARCRFVIKYEYTVDF